MRLPILHDLRHTLRKAFSLTEDTASHEEIKQRIISGGQVTGTNMCILICAILIASVGLNTGSTAVIIGAMLISPLMGTILATAYGTAAADVHRFRRSLFGFFVQVIISLIVSVTYFTLSPINAPSSELLARTQPSIYDVVIATAGGVAGIIGNTRADKANNVIPGVAIATALMPPLCTCGYSIAHFEWQMLAGAAYLFMVNCYFIFMAAVLILDLLKIPKVRALSDKQWRKVKKAMLRNAIIVLIPSILLTYLMFLDQ
ncbi:MAG: DUF389 domain-containing protein [Oscillospiraceae bacterium]|nr:DUF389 domain-containing protein [Oscillospiraceae bacterium]